MCSPARTTSAVFLIAATWRRWRRSCAPASRGSIVGTRSDLAEAIEFAREGKVRSQIEKAPLQDINGVFTKLKRGVVNGRIVLDLTAS